MRRGRPGRTPRPSGLWVSAALLLLAACGPRAAAETPPPPRDLEGHVRPELLASYQALAAAVEARDDDVARRILARLLARQPEGGELELARAFERVLDGRARVADLDLELESRLAEGRVKVWLVAASAEDAVVQTGGGMVRATFNSVEASGGEERRVSTRALPELSRLELRAGEPLRLELGAWDLPIGSALAARARFSLKLVAGEIETAEGVVPAMRFQVEPCEVVRLAGWLPNEPVDPSYLVEYVRGPRIETPALLERTVRIAPSRRREALDRLTPVALELDRVRLSEILPALRWLADSSRLGGDPDAWREWLVERALELERDDKPALDLPETLHARGAEPGRAGEGRP